MSPLSDSGAEGRSGVCCRGDGVDCAFRSRAKGISSRGMERQRCTCLSIMRENPIIGSSFLIPSSIRSGGHMPSEAPRLLERNGGYCRVIACKILEDSDRASVLYTK